MKENLIFKDDLNEHIRLWRGVIDQVHEITPKENSRYFKKGLVIPQRMDHILIELNHCSRQSAAGVNGRSVAICDKPVMNTFHIQGFKYGFFFYRGHNLKPGDDIIFVPCVNVYKPNIIYSEIKSYYIL